jgi:hypothetical protein
MIWMSAIAELPLIGSEILEAPGRRRASDRPSSLGHPSSPTARASRQKIREVAIFVRHTILRAVLSFIKAKLKSTKCDSAFSNKFKLHGSRSKD